MPVVWEKSGEAFYATSERDQSGERYYLVVDVLPNGGWNWSVWRQGDDWRIAVNGTAPTARDAMRAAEAAAK
jgi:hypothetical protein